MTVLFLFPFSPLDVRRYACGNAYEDVVSVRFYPIPTVGAIHESPECEGGEDVTICSPKVVLPQRHSISVCSATGDSRIAPTA